jgi:hypothetical protein
MDRQGRVRQATASATALPLERSAVTACIDPAERLSDATFQRAFERSLAALHPAARRGALGGVTGHVAESVVEIVLESLGWTPVWHFLGPGRHGIDLLLLGPGVEQMVAVEVKGTLRPRCWPRLRSGELTQMDLGWIDKSDNPAMTEWAVTSEDVHGAIVLVNFADLVYKAVVTSDFTTWHPIDRIEQLETLEWLDR